MAKEEKEVKTPKPKEKVEWKVNLVIVDEEQPPKKVLVKGEETLDLYAALAKSLNNQEHIMEALLN